MQTISARVRLRRLYRLPVKIRGRTNATSLVGLSIVQPNLREGVTAD